MALWFGAAPEADLIGHGDPQSAQSPGPSQFGQGMASATAVLARQQQQNAMMQQYSDKMNQQLQSNALGALGQQAGLGMGGVGYGAQVQREKMTSKVKVGTPSPLPNPPHGA